MYLVFVVILGQLPCLECNFLHVLLNWRLCLKRNSKVSRLAISKSTLDVKTRFNWRQRFIKPQLGTSSFDLLRLTANGGHIKSAFWLHKSWSQCYISPCTSAKTQDTLCDPWTFANIKCMAFFVAPTNLRSHQYWCQSVLMLCNNATEMPDLFIIYFYHRSFPEFQASKAFCPFELGE